MQRLRQYLVDHSLTQAEFARQLGVSQATVSYWLSGECRPSTEMLIEISANTGLSIDDLLKAA